MQRLLASVGMPRVASGAGYAYRMPEPGRRVALGPEFHGDLELLRWFAAEGLDARGGTLSAPMYRLLERPARRTLWGVPVVSLPRDCRPVPGAGGNAGSYFFVRYYVDDGILVELQWWPDGRRCLRAVQSLASDYFSFVWRARCV